MKRIPIILALVATTITLPAATASAAAAPCKPSPFHFTVTKYSNLQAVTTGAQLIGQPSTAVYNPGTRPLTVNVTLTRAQSSSMTVSASVTVEASAVVSSIQAQVGLAATKTSTISTAVSIPVRIPPKSFGWVQAKVGRATIKGTVTQIDAICNAVLYRGPITIQTPYGRPWLEPFVGLRPPR